MVVSQANLMGKPIVSKDQDKPWLSLGCCKRCYFAKGKRCTCKCKGAFHGLGKLNETKMQEDDEK